MAKIFPITETRCVAPYVSTQINAAGLLKVCCEYRDTKDILPYTEFDRWWNEDLNKLRQELNNNVQHEQCGNCWGKESINYHSYRNYLNDVYQADFQNYELLYNQDKPNMPKHVHLNFGNMCNLKCIMCHPQYSSSIHTEVKLHETEYNKFISKYHQIQNGTYIGKDVNYSALWFKEKTFSDLSSKLLSNADRIFLTGGEPLMSLESFNTLNELKNKSNIDLVITTNGSLISDKWISLLSQFKSLNITISLEGVGKANDYLRNGSDWNIILHNIYLVKSLTNLVSFQIATVIQHTSFYTFIDLINFVELENININFTILNEPKYLSVNTLTPEEIDTFKTNLEHNKKEWNKKLIDSLLSLLSEKYNFDEKNRVFFFDYINMLDSIRNTKFKETFYK